MSPCQTRQGTASNAAIEHSCGLAVQDKAAGGVLSANMNASVWSALTEAPIWARLGRPVPALAADLLKQRDRVQLIAAQAHALTRSYNRVSMQNLALPLG